MIVDPELECPCVDDTLRAQRSDTESSIRTRPRRGLHEASTDQRAVCRLPCHLGRLIKYPRISATTHPDVTRSFARYAGTPLLVSGSLRAARADVSKSPLRLRKFTTLLGSND